MSYLSLYFQAHQPRRLNRNPTVSTPFNDALDREIVEKMAATTYVPVNRLLKQLILENEGFAITVGVSGPLLEQARRFNPGLLKSFQQLAEAGRETGRVEFLGETRYHSLAGLFSEHNKNEFRQQIRFYRELVQELLGVEPVTFRNSELFFNNSIADVVADCGYDTILCEKRGDITAGVSPDNLFTDRHRKIKIIPRNGELSEELLNSLAHYNLATEEFARWVGGILGDIVLVGITYEGLAAAGENASQSLEFWNRFPRAIARHPQVKMKTPSAVAAAGVCERMLGGQCRRSRYFSVGFGGP